MFVSTYGPSSETKETARKVFWNYLDDCLQTFCSESE